MRALHRILSILSLLLGFIVSATAQRPILFTESPVTTGRGKLTAGLGVEYLKKNKVTPLRAPRSLWKIPVTRIYLGLGEIVDVIVDWQGRLFAEQGTCRHVSDWGDISLGTKINFLMERKSRPALGVVFPTKFPNTSHDGLLGSNHTDFFLSLLGSKAFREVELRGNLGLGILDDPERPHSQLDIFTMGIACIFPIRERHTFFSSGWASWVPR